MPIQLPDLPYDQAALEPHLSARTLEFHYGKHHKGYVTKLNAAIENTSYADLSLEQIVTAASENGDAGIFNNAAQVWNHTFLWHSMAPDGGGAPAGDLAGMIDTAFGSFEEFCASFRQAAAGQFGSGWAWLVQDDGQLSIVTTGNADTPVLGKARPLLTLDVWEHAYYLDYQNDRASYIDTYLAHLVNWQFAAANLN
ncbi:MAG: superoxide dismutase [Gammaproteobacteria bacterium]|nr:superoxide dismutase [Gammaproteobacteria bacterium]